MAAAACVGLARDPVMQHRAHQEPVAWSTEVTCKYGTFSSLVLHSHLDAPSFPDVIWRTIPAYTHFKIVLVEETGTRAHACLVLQVLATASCWTCRARLYASAGAGCRSGLACLLHRAMHRAWGRGLEGLG